MKSSPLRTPFSPLRAPLLELPRPVFVDIEPATFNIDVTLIEAAVTDRTRAVIPVHLFGQMADMAPLMDLVHSLNQKPETRNQKPIIVIEDAAQAIGAEYKGRRAGSIGDYGTFSFFPSKILEGRATRDGRLPGRGAGGAFEDSAQSRFQAQVLPQVHRRNFRLDTIQAAVVLAKLKHLDVWTAARQKHARVYRDLFQESGLSGNGIVLPEVCMDRHIYNQFVIRCQDRDGLQRHLVDRALAQKSFIPLPLHLQECFAYLGYAPGDFPQAELRRKSPWRCPSIRCCLTRCWKMSFRHQPKPETRNQQPQ
jgi:dTDP-4-amino-4,6-dideoxygalactose transaminase